MTDSTKTASRRGLKLVLSLGLSALFLYLALASLAGCPDGGECVSGQCVFDGASGCADETAGACVTCVDWSTLPHLLSDVSIWSLILFSLGYALVHSVRVVRWYFLLRPLGLRRFRPALNAGVIGLAAIVIVPLRLGELVRPYLISRDTKITMSSALGTAVVERVIDGLTVTLALFATLALLPTRADQPAAVWTAGTISALIFGSVMTVLLLSWWQREMTVRVLRRIGNTVSERLTEKAIGLLEGFLDGVAALRHGWELYAFFGTTVLYWATNAATLVYLANAFGLEISLAEGIGVTSILVIGIMIPGGPGHVGTFEFFLRIGLGLYVAVGEMPDRVLAYIAVLHVLQFLVQIGLGLPFWLADGLSLKRALSSSGGAPAGETAGETAAAEREAV